VAVPVLAYRSDEGSPVAQLAIIQAEASFIFEREWLRDAKLAYRGDDADGFVEASATFLGLSRHALLLPLSPRVVSCELAAVGPVTAVPDEVACSEAPAAILLGLSRLALLLMLLHCVVPDKLAAVGAFAAFVRVRG